MDLRAMDRRVWLLTAGQLVLSVGRGVLLPFATLYFYNERGFPLAVIGLAFAIALPVGALIGLFWGALSDRIGRKPLMMLGFIGQATTTVGLAFISVPAQYVALVLLQAIGVSAWNPAARAMVADITAPAKRTEAYGLLYMSNNAGLSIGLVLGGALAIFLPYRALFFIEAAGAAAFLLVVMLTIRESHRASARTDPDARPLARVAAHLKSVATPLRDARFLVYSGAYVLAGFGWAQFYITYSPYMANVVGLDDAWIGTLFAVNTLMVVLLQIPLARWASRRTRTGVYVLASHLLAWSLLLMWLGGRVEGPEVALLVLGLSIAIMTIGEILVVPVGSALAAGLAGGEQNYGKYMAALELTWTTAGGLGSILGGAFFDAGRPMLLWPVVTGLVILSFGGFALLARMLPPEVNGPTAQASAAATPTRLEA